MLGILSKMTDTRKLVEYFNTVAAHKKSELLQIVKEQKRQLRDSDRAAATLGAVKFVGIVMSNIIPQFTV